MRFSSPRYLKRRRLTNIDPMEAEAAKAKLGAAKEKYGREIRVFDTFRTSETPAEVVNYGEERDGFYDFTPEDYFHLMSTKKEEKFLKTRKIREAEEAAKRSKIHKATPGHLAVIRVRFPDNLTLEATFHPSEPVQTLADLMKEVLVRPDMPHYIYTTPPKKQVSNTSQNFYSAGFVPGAIVYFSYNLPRDDVAHSGPFLHEDLIALNGLDVFLEPTKATQAESEAVPAESQAAMVNTPHVAQEQKEKKAVKPKWLKM
ncbi:Plant UBX domain-containing protein [Drosera capensis]